MLLIIKAIKFIKSFHENYELSSFNLKSHFLPETPFSRRKVNKK